METIIIKNVNEIKCPYCEYDGSDLNIGRNPIGINNMGLLSLRCSKCKDTFIIKLITDIDFDKILLK